MIRRRLEVLEKSSSKPLDQFGGFSVPRWSELVMGEQTPQTQAALEAEWPRWVRFFRDLLRMPASPADETATAKPKQK